jgi:hypothetical protein
MATIKNLLDKAKRAILCGETHFRAAADHLVQARKLGASQRQSAKAIGKSPAWVNRLLKWRDSGCRDAPFGPQSQGRNVVRRVLRQPQQSPRGRTGPPTTVEQVAKAETQKSQFEFQTARAQAVTAMFGATISNGLRGQLVAALAALPSSHPIERVRARLGMSWDALLVPAAAESKRSEAA